MEQQREAGTLGMWVFLVTEIMFFGGMFRLTRSIIGNSRSVRDSQQPFGHLPRRFQYGRADLSSFTMALAVYFTQIGKPRPQVWCSVLTLILGLTFLGVKAVEYRGKFHDNLIPG